VRNVSVSIIGPGALGTLFAARIAKSGTPVQLIGRNKQALDSINASGITFEVDREIDTVGVRACSIEQADTTDLCIFFTKAQDLMTAAESVVRHMPSAHLVTMQNGLGHGQRLSSIVRDPSMVTHGVTMVPADLRGVGNVETHGQAKSWLGPLIPEGLSCTTEVVDLLCRAGFFVELTTEPEVRIWNKACFNVAMNGLCALIDGSPGLLERFPDGKQLAHEIADEVIRVGLAEGVQVSADDVHGLIDMACANHTYHRPSMVQDLLQSRLTEIDALNGFVSERAEQYGLLVPKTTMIYRLVKLRERSPEFWARQ
jgi:2-dehydropantoate 2-reductase